jgi:hypothetical protein
MTGVPVANGVDDEITVLIERRRVWLNATVAVADRDPSVAGLWLVGSEGRGEADAFSDFDVFIAFAGESLRTISGDECGWFSRFGRLVRCRENPVNAPADGRFFSAAYVAPIVPLAVDYYLQPSGSVQVGTDAAVLVDKIGLERSRPPALTSELFPTRVYRPPQDRGELLRAQVDGFSVMVTIAAKYLCRGRDDLAGEIIDRLQRLLASVAQEADCRVGPWPDKPPLERLQVTVGAMRDLTPRLEEQGIAATSTDEVDSWLGLLARRRSL